MDKAGDKRKEYYAVGILGLCFMLIFTAFNSLQNMISSLYAQQGFQTLGQIALFAIYISFGFSNFLTAYVLERVSYRRLMFLSSLGYLAFQMTGLLVTNCSGHHQGFCQKGVIYSVVILFSMVCGFSAAFLWGAQAAYISDLSTPTTKGQLFGLFWGLSMGSQIFGNVFSTFMLGKISPSVYFVVLCAIGVTGSLMFGLVKPTGKQSLESRQPLSLRARLAEMNQLIHQPNSRSIKLLYSFTGVTVACYAGFLYKLVNRSYQRAQNQSDDQYLKELKFHTGLVFIVLGVFQVLAGLLMNRVGDLFNRYRMVSFGMTLGQAALLVSLLTYFLNQYWLCFVASGLWGMAEVQLQSNTAALISSEYEGKVAAFSIFRAYQAFGVTITLGISILMTHLNLPDWAFIVVVIFFQMVVTTTTEQLQGRLEGRLQGRLHALKSPILAAQQNQIW